MYEDFFYLWGLQSVTSSCTVIIENKKFFEFKKEGYRDGIKKRRQDRDGIAHLE